MKRRTRRSVKPLPPIEQTFGAAAVDGMIDLARRSAFVDGCSQGRADAGKEFQASVDTRRYQLAADALRTFSVVADAMAHTIIALVKA